MRDTSPVEDKPLHHILYPDNSLGYPSPPLCANALLLVHGWNRDMVIAKRELI